VLFPLPAPLFVSFCFSFTLQSPIVSSHIIFFLFYALLLWSVQFLSLGSWFFFPQILVAFSRSSNLIGSFTSQRTNHRPPRPLYNNVCTSCSEPLSVKPMGCPGTHDTRSVTFQKRENLKQNSCLHLTVIKMKNKIQFYTLFYRLWNVVILVTAGGYSYCVRHCRYYIMDSSYQNKSVKWRIGWWPLRVECWSGKWYGRNKVGSNWKMVAISYLKLLN